MHKAVYLFYMLALGWSVSLLAGNSSDISPSTVYDLSPTYLAVGISVTPVGISNAVQIVADNSGDNGTSIKLGGIGLLGDGEMAGIEWTATGSGVLAFDWKVSSEADNDWLRFYEVGATTTNQISGTTGAWSRVVVSVAGDTNAIHTFRWEYEKDPVGDYVGSDCGWVDAMSWSPFYALTVNSGTGSGAYTNGATVTINADVPPMDQKFDRWTGDTNNVANVFTSPTVLIMSSSTVTVTATYVSMLHSLTVINGSGGGVRLEGSKVNVSADPDPLWKEFAAWTGDATELLADVAARTTLLTMPTRPATLTATYRDSIARLTGSYGRTYTESGTAGAITPDAGAGSPFGTPAVKLGGTGVIPDNGFSAFETVVSGSGSILFQWKVSSEANADYLKFKVDGGEVAAISGTKGPWTQVSNRVETAGSHTLRWEYVKNGSNASSSDAGWVDDIVWIGDVENPAITPNMLSAIATNNQIVLDFIGERGISYVLQTNATFNAIGWTDWQQFAPVYSGETNGEHRFNIVPPMLGHKKMFYRIIGR